MVPEAPLHDLSPSGGVMPPVVARYAADREALERRLSAPWSPVRASALRDLASAWSEAVQRIDFGALDADDRADCVLFERLLAMDLEGLQREARWWDETAALVPFAADLIALLDERCLLDDQPARDAAGRLHAAAEAALALQREIERPHTAGEARVPDAPSVAARAARTLDKLRGALAGWRAFRSGYDPEFDWWVGKPQAALEETLNGCAEALRTKAAGIDGPDAIAGDPAGREAILRDLQLALVPYTPEELVAIAREEQAWCLAELRRAASEMGLGDDWRAAIECVKEDHVPPGAQPALVRDLAREAAEFVEERGLVTVPPLARDFWRMEMMSAERQKVNPFFLGGEAIIVSYPTSDMEHERKRMALRGNNRHFSRATVQHELIPGHGLQAFFQKRYRPYRLAFHTPFWTEGWALHWEMLLWEAGFARTPEERVGMLFWRLHRCVRVVFSLGFHLGELTAPQCVEMLVEEVGHERENALGEVRRSFGDDYEPLYQCAYLIGGLQMHALRGEARAAGWTDRRFHDAVLRANSMPIAVLRALLLGLPIPREFPCDWRFR